MVSKSFTMAGVSSCSGCCQYCSAALSQNYIQPYLYLSKDKMDAFAKHIDEKTSKEFVADWDKFKETVFKDKQIQFELEEAKKQNRKPELHVDLWGANPLSCWTVFKITVGKVKEIFDGWIVRMSTSDNGVGLNTVEKLDYLIKNGIELQLSHDGYGEWLRLPFDPLKEEPYASLWLEALKKGVWTAWNLTLSQYNYSFFKNLDFANSILNQVPNKHYLKLNHVYNSSYDIKTINKDGRWQDTVVEELKGKPIGRWELHNGTNEWDKHVLDDYLSEFMHLAILCQDPHLMNDPRFKHVRAYMQDQASRNKYLSSHDQKSGACRAYQRYKHQIGDKSSWSDQTFVIDTLGNYSECNLIDSNHTVENPGGEQPDYCKGCRFELHSECNSCGSMPFANTCEYPYQFNRMLEMQTWIKGLVQSSIKAEQERIWSNIVGNKSCQCRN